MDDQRRISLLHWVKQKHKGQKIRESGKPYFSHLLTVAKMAASATAMGFEIGLCHDLLEDTKTNVTEFKLALSTCGYTSEECTHIATCVIELTDVFSKEDYPDLSKSIRKTKEAERLATISAAAQTVKYCDLIYNIGWMLEYDKKHLKKYLNKKRLLLQVLDKGDKKLRQKALELIKIVSS